MFIPFDRRDRNRDGDDRRTRDERDEEVDIGDPRLDPYYDPLAKEFDTPPERDITLQRGRSLGGHRVPIYPARMTQTTADRQGEWILVDERELIDVARCG